MKTVVYFCAVHANISTINFRRLSHSVAFCFNVHQHEKESSLEHRIVVFTGFNHCFATAGLNIHEKNERKKFAPNNSKRRTNEKAPNQFDDENAIKVMEKSRVIREHRRQIQTRFGQPKINEIE